MQQIHATSLGIGLAVLIQILNSYPVQACTCAAGGSPASGIKNSAAVFAGKVIDGFRIPSRGVAPGSTEYRFAVSHVWKGATAETIHVRTGPTGGMCGYEFEIGQSYLVYAGERGGQLSTSICSRTQALHHAFWDRIVLGEAIELGRTATLAVPTIPMLFDSLRSGDRTARYRAAEALANQPNDRREILRFLVHMIRQQSQGDEEAIWALGEMRKDALPAEPDLAWALQNSHPRARGTALRALSEIVERPRFLNYEWLALAQEQVPVLEAAFTYVGWARPDSAYKALRHRFGRRLLQLLRHDEPYVRTSAARSLHSEYPEFRKETLRALRRMSKRDRDRGARFEASMLLKQEPLPR